ncbi:site-specific recombinase XerD [Microbacterium resistens]|uniref:Site-specific recombinase XerD n=1 Tax=Microbacterium resistens TaxID=156977 RepID=A0ABU1SF16_9MICO|nr:tyrosine-type recombinase/integrase [Microbacterium resistens]MDR6868159.1 site-specific recombinase XerD [Microbacterium resistens]
MSGTAFPNYRNRTRTGVYGPGQGQADPETEGLLEEFAIDQRAAGLTASTVRQRLSTVRALVTMQGVSLLTATARDLKVFLGRERISAGTRRGYRVVLRAFFKFLQDAGLRPDDPAANLPPVRVLRRHARPFSAEQIDAMMTTGAYRRTRVMILLGYVQGFRVSQIARVHGRDIDLVAGTISTVGKHGKETTFPLHPMLAEFAHEMPQDDWWFPARAGSTAPDGHIFPSSVSSQISEAKRRAGITDPTLTAHSLRHSFGSHLFANGADIRVIQELMAHETIETTQIYVGVTQQQKTAALNALPGVAMPARSGRPPAGRHALTGASS